MKELKLEDYQIIQPYLDMANYEGYNSNFVTMMMWNHEYHIQYEIHEHFLVMLHNYKGIYFWAMPFTSPKYYQKAIDYMITYSQNHHFDFMIDCAIEDFVETIRPFYQDKLLFERTPYNDDYIYDRQMLQTLSGKKMQKRRNHYNAFVKEHPDYVYRDLDLTNDFDIILECLSRWETEKDALSETMTSEIQGILYLLSSQHLLDFKVGGIFINQQIQAFIIASRLKHSTIQIHVEKANKDIRGLYPAILKEMLEHHFPNEKYVNREEDMGLENLRKSKQALHPVKMIHKYRIVEKKFVITQANDNDFQEIKQLWLNNFSDENEQTTQFYFQNYYKAEYTYVLKNNGNLISVLQIVPFSLSQNSKMQKGYFILGVCTKKNFEGQGCMKYLMNDILKKYHNYPIYLQAYVPDIYHRFGFHASHYHQIVNLDKSFMIKGDIEPIEDYSLLNEYYLKYTKQFNAYRMRNQEYWDLFLQRCQVFNEQVVVFKDKGYMVYYQDEKCIYIHEFIYLSLDSAKQMLSYFIEDEKDIVVETDLKIELPGEKKYVIAMMSNQIGSDQMDSSLYINEIY